MSKHSSGPRLDRIPLIGGRLAMLTRRLMAARRSSRPSGSSHPRGRDRLHLGCADVRLEGFLNADVRATAATDLVLDCSDLDGLAAHSFSLIYSNAFLEHLYIDERERCLRGVHRVLKVDGVAVFTGIPDFEQVARAYLGAEAVNSTEPGSTPERFDLYQVYRYTHGAPEQVPWRFAQLHKSLFDKDTIEELLRKSGFRCFCIFRYGWGNERTPANCGFVAYKGSPSVPMTACWLVEYLGRFPTHANLATIEILGVSH